MSKEAYIASKVLASQPMPPKPIVRPSKVDVFAADIDQLISKLRGCTLNPDEVQYLANKVSELRHAIDKCDVRYSSPSRYLSPSQYIIDKDGKRKHIFDHVSTK